MEINLTTIGIAKNKYREKYRDWEDTVTKIYIDEKYQDGLYKLEEFSHIQVIFYLHKVKNYSIKLVPQGKIGILPEVGVFATRTQYRPSPIGVSIAEVINIKGNVITVKGLDVLNNTPIIDIKPYIPDHKNIKYKIPSWVKKLEEINK
ncbi:tRNA (N6-threonylcarbamoyladenosine(37)-N6)-methyltransferase TrmO [Candidatus Gottesmanbacteria bacterium CG11_big_fil_rev_8_21_14_0_20_37_11]|uniref:tRNA (N6-threonylcarbamoyladenosine(37)-N6)-methyltransferase TrmO n=3 Tax=Candidatus Gottesmaniibacteriota TaxID=1752720 RepID=A0A2M7RRQ2_9BACT|nr:MAG: tRNA (N6-threonylcarbamoyladenosine(37)-N6)-methyltransferase TrmO [Candidatus Gottesmanbacteria bacterium CG1_02_37_22]PIP32886.1 MAG: tRNA (N6-threonylcarbamoyladenosine(37)-N6)-methyltransferase TrmO [Candidatus Gottesmanbacteria bacterium CG23_combo_of_CG06-09_8_20_14_all_37_19]PIR08304.1 MAG: tRNA (N6-threonylcarbamoyladenosine(37)-N6)-methyltransferase TrmO [Candidatus Gottesmanbacteria bacterium CG11_big_fil_rev_8_21_14_0_20_37_11]PIZ03001.1 MAG: tRNA (N6-threonylcarbamoyladenosin